ncbi:hypothetical protein [Vibrio campbellii]|nr:hypothetical protein [Vibrio campbellii]
MEGRVFFPIKASYEPIVLKTLVNNSISGFEVMSYHELKHIRALFGYQYPLIFSGLCPDECTLRLLCFEQDILVINSLNDCFRVVDLLQSSTDGSRITLLLRISFPCLNSEIGYNGRNSKLGIIAYSNEMYRCLELLERHEGINLEGIHCHQLIHESSASEYRKMIHQMAKLIDSIESSTSFKLAVCDIGGGLESMPNIKTRSVVKQICQEFNEILPDRSLIFEPGRALVNSGGICVTKVIGQRVRTQTHHCTVDVGSNLLVPTSSKRYHIIHEDIINSEASLKEASCAVKVTFSDRVLSPANTIEDNVMMLSPPQVGSLLLIGNAGAYTSALEHQWLQPLHSTYFLSSSGDIETLLSSEDALAAWKGRWGTDV